MKWTPLFGPLRPAVNEPTQRASAHVVRIECMEFAVGLRVCVVSSAPNRPIGVGSERRRPVREMHEVL